MSGLLPGMTVREQRRPIDGWTESSVEALRFVVFIEIKDIALVQEGVARTETAGKIRGRT